MRESERERDIVIKRESEREQEAVLEKENATEREKKDGAGVRERERKKKTNLLKILQIAPVYNSSKLPTNQSRVPITLPFNLDTMAVDVSVAVETRGEARRIAVRRAAKLRATEGQRKG